MLILERTVSYFPKPTEAHILSDRIGNGGDEGRRHLRPIQFFQMDLNLPRGHPMRIERQHLVVKAVEPPLPFLDHGRFKHARPIARHRQVDWPCSVCTIFGLLPFRALSGFEGGRV